MDPTTPRDLVGYGANPPDAKWPGGAQLALSIVLNYEEGAEYSVLYGDAHSETLNSEHDNPKALYGIRSAIMESFYEYGSRVGFWRILKVLRDRDIPITVLAVGLALEQNSEVAGAIAEAGYEVAGHGWRWIDYQDIGPQEERAHLKKTIDVIERMTGSRPLGWFLGRPSPNTRRLIVEEGGFLYDSDAFNDDLPYWVLVDGKPHLILPYSVDNNDIRYTRGQGLEVADEFFTYLKDCFDWLYREGRHAPRMMSVGLHCRLIGRPGRMAALERFLDHVQKHDNVWICRRVEIARHWRSHHAFSA